MSTSMPPRLMVLGVGVVPSELKLSDPVVVVVPSVSETSQVVGDVRVNEALSVRALPCTSYTSIEVCGDVVRVPSAGRLPLSLTASVACGAMVDEIGIDSAPICALTLMLPLVSAIQ